MSEIQSREKPESLEKSEYLSDDLFNELYDAIRLVVKFGCYDIICVNAKEMTELFRCVKSQKKNYESPTPQCLMPLFSKLEEPVKNAIKESFKNDSSNAINDSSNLGKPLKYYALQCYAIKYELSGQNIKISWELMWVLADKVLDDEKSYGLLNRNSNELFLTPFNI